STIIKARRSIKPVAMNGKKIPDYQVESLLELADWAPTHGFTEPWRFVVYGTASDFSHQHAKLYKCSTRPENFDQDVYNKLYDHVIGILYLGYADSNPEGNRAIPLEEKITWVK